MNILIVTELIDKNHGSFGFFHGRMLDFAKECRKLTIICLELHEHNLPHHIKILSLGKEKRKSRVVYTWKLLKYIWTERRNYDSVFVHLTPHYVVLGGWLWRLLGKDVVLWYNHTFVDWWLWAAEKFANRILTTSENKFRIKSNKVRIFDGKTDLEAYSCYIHEERNRR
ncbi:MAG: hypothetical protein AAB850_00660 [Patescibacteria group bacterium]